MIRIQKAILSLLLVVAASIPRHALADEPKSPYEECVSRLFARASSGTYGATNLEKFYRRASTDYAKCEKLLPAEDEGDERKYSRLVLGQLKPEDRDGLVLQGFRLEGGAGYQTGIGATIPVSGGIEVWKRRSALHSFGDGYELRISGGSRLKHGDSALGRAPVARGRAELRDSVKLDVSDFIKKKGEILKLAEAASGEPVEDPADYPGLEGITELTISKLYRLNFDRDLSLGREWDASAAYGYGLGARAKDRAGSVNVVGTAGVGEMGAAIPIPYAHLSVEGDGFICGSLGTSDRHQLCLSADAAMKLGLVTVGASANVTGQYRWVYSSNKKHYLGAGVTVSGSSELDLAGGHSQGGAFLAVEAK